METIAGQEELIISQKLNPTQFGIMNNTVKFHEPI